MRKSYLLFRQSQSHKKIILYNNLNKILQELVLPGEIWHFLENVRDNDLKESDIDKFIDKSKRKVHFTIEYIKSLKSFEKIFLYNLYINQNFIKNDLEAIYSSCFTSDMHDKNYFIMCINKFKDHFIKIKIGTIDFEIDLKDAQKNRFEFAHPIYHEAIEKLINTEEVERLTIEEILKKFHDLIRFQSIDEWNTDTCKSIIILGDSHYETIKFNIYTIILKHYTVLNIQIKDLVFEILYNLSFGDGLFSGRGIYFSGADDLELKIPEFCDGHSKFLTELFNNYEKLVEEQDYVNALFKKDELKINIAYCFAYRLNSNIVTNFQDRLNELSNGNEEVKRLIAKCIIKHYDFLNENNKKLLYNIGVKESLLMQFFIHNYSFLSRDLQETLEKQIVNSDKTLLIESCKTFLLNYSLLPNEIRRHYEFIFCLNDELVIKEVGKAFEEWFRLAFIDMWHDPKRENLNENVLDLYCSWLKNEKIISANYPEIIELYGEGGVHGCLGWLPDSIFPHSLENIFLINPKWNNPYISKLKAAFETNMMILLNSLNSSIDRAIIYGTAFDCYTWSGNLELFNQISGIINETDDAKYAFLEGCFHFEINIEKVSKYPLKITVYQTDLIKKLSEVSNSLHLRTKANEVLEYMKTLMENHLMEIVPDDYS